MNLHVLWQGQRFTIQYLMATNIQPAYLPSNHRCNVHLPSISSNGIPDIPLPYVHTLAQPIQLHAPPTFPSIKEKLNKKAKVRWFDANLMKKLTRLPSKLNKGYRRTLFECNHTLVQDGKKLSTKYCNSRWCSTCNRMRTGKMMNAYLPIIQTMPTPLMVVVTIPNVKGSELRASLVGMNQTFTNIKRSLKRLKMPFNGIRKIECTYNVDTDTYHPHLHLILDDEHSALMFVDGWLARYPDAVRKAQHITRIEDADGLKEVFKYSTKLITDIKHKKERAIIPTALDTIFNALTRMRTIQPFGNVKQIDDELKEVETTTYEWLEDEWNIYEWIEDNWYSCFGEPLTEFKPSHTLKSLFIRCPLPT